MILVPEEPADGADALVGQPADPARVHLGTGSAAEFDRLISLPTGVGSARPHGAPELTGMLLTGQRAEWLAENPIGTREPSTRCLWWPPGRAVGRMLAKRIAAWDPSVDYALPIHPEGSVIRTPVALGCSERHSAGAGREVSADVRAARLRDIDNRQLMAVRRRERAAAAELRTLSAKLETLTAHQQEVIHELQRHGYLHDRGKASTGRAPGSA